MSADNVTFSDLETLLVAWVAAATGFDANHVIIENQNAPAPAGQYASLYGPRLVPETELEETQDEPADDATDVTVNSRGQYAVFATFTIHGDGDKTARDVCFALQRAITQRAARDMLEPLAVVDTQEMQTLPQQLATQFESRAQFTAQLRVGLQDSEVIPFIKSVEITGATGSVLDPFTFTAET